MKITKTVTWDSDDVRAVCIAHGFYTCGDNEAYSRMLDYVNGHPPKKKALYKVAKDIHRHSRINLPVESIMNILDQNAVRTSYRIEGGEGQCQD